MKHNSFDKNMELVAETSIFQSTDKYFYAIDTIDAKTNHVEITFIINFIINKYMTLKMYSDSLYLVFSLIFFYAYVNILRKENH